MDSHPRRMNVETQVHRTKEGVICRFKKKLAGWVLTAGESVGWAFLSPYVLEDFSPSGIVLSNSGVIEMINPLDGESYFIKA